MRLQRTVQAIIRPDDESGWVAECGELHAVTQGDSLDEVTANLREAVALALEGEDLAELGLAPSPHLTIKITDLRAWMFQRCHHRF
jgi:predicted RNase H-like HicB family nuclease